MCGPSRDGPASCENRSHLCRLRILGYFGVGVQGVGDCSNSVEDWSEACTFNKAFLDSQEGVSRKCTYRDTSLTRKRSPP